MGDIFVNLGIDQSLLILIQGGLTIVLMIIMILLMVQNFKQKRRIDRFLLGKNCESLEEKILSMAKDVESIREQNETISGKFEEMSHGIKCSYKKISIVKYDAFKGMKGKLSFVLCILDDFDSGYLINNMKGSDGNYTYLKEIIHGKSIVALGNEEKQALEEALQSEKYE